MGCLAILAIPSTAVSFFFSVWIGMVFWDIIDYTAGICTISLHGRYAGNNSNVDGDGTPTLGKSEDYCTACELIYLKATFHQQPHSPSHQAVYHQTSWQLGTKVGGL